MESDLVQSIADAIQAHEGDFPGSRSRRNFNPGNMRSGQGQSGTDPEGYAIFPDSSTGMDALRHQIQLNIDRGLNLNEFFGGKGDYQGYAPSKDKNDPKAYAQFVADKLGIKPTDVLGGGTMSAAPNSFSNMSTEEINKRLQELRAKVSGQQQTQGKGPVVHAPTGGMTDAQILSTNRQLTPEQENRKQEILHHERQGQFFDELGGAAMGTGAAVAPLRTALGVGGSVAGHEIPRAMGAPEDVQWAGSMIGGLAGGGLPSLWEGPGSLATNLRGVASMPTLKRGAGALVGGEILHRMGVPRPIADAIVGALSGMTGGSKLGGVGGDKPGTMPPATETRMMEGISTGTLSDEDFLRIYGDHKIDPALAQSRLDVAKQQAAQSRQAVTMRPKPMFQTPTTPQSGTGLGNMPPQTQAPPQVQVVNTNAPQTPAPSMTPVMGQQFPPPPAAPPEPPQPQNMTIGPEGRWPPKGSSGWWAQQDARLNNPGSSNIPPAAGYPFNPPPSEPPPQNLTGGPLPVNPPRQVGNIPPLGGHQLTPFNVSGEVHPPIEPPLPPKTTPSQMMGPQADFRIGPVERPGYKGEPPKSTPLGALPKPPELNTEQTIAGSIVTKNLDPVNLKEVGPKNRAVTGRATGTKSPTTQQIQDGKLMAEYMRRNPSAPLHKLGVRTVNGNREAYIKD